MPKAKPTIRDRIEARCMPEPNTGCWIWTGPVMKKSMRPKLGVRNRPQLAARLSYQAYVGPIADGLLVCHRCDTPLCVNPNHLWLGTYKDNTQDMIRKGRANFQKRAA